MSSSSSATPNNASSYLIVTIALFLTKAHRLGTRLQTSLNPHPCPAIHLAPTSAKPCVGFVGLILSHLS